MSKKQPVEPVSKSEAISILSAQLRRKDLRPQDYIKLTTHISRLQGWNRAKSGEDARSSIEQEILEIERKRKAQRQQ